MEEKLFRRENKSIYRLTQQMSFFNRFHLHWIIYYVKDFLLDFFGLLSKQYSCSVASLSEYASKSIPGVFFFKPLYFLLIEISKIFFWIYGNRWDVCIVNVFYFIQTTLLFETLVFKINCSRKWSDKSSLFKTLDFVNTTNIMFLAVFSLIEHESLQINIRTEKYHLFLLDFEAKNIFEFHFFCKSLYQRHLEA